MRKVTAWAKPLPLVHDPYALPSDLVKVTFSPTEELTEEQLLADDDEYLPTVFRNEEEKEK